ncbi:hypothetical protein [Elizabethkingia miricola]|uniref:hypothetical protein n=1 Tax=Elizabethkingia miricola TaxID=172045 RepID=UPI00099951D9|nr:hypothetical protein [Elizabethkingia miricola]OPC16259.1 hypothetical protein BAY01_00720 [Elizabethkingia miricola]
MSRKGNTDRELKKTIELGYNNKRVIPLVKNWCKHIIITDRSAGMIAELYHLPMMQEISCPHTTNKTSALNFEWIAHDFIIESCIDCKFHKEVSPNNYGKPLLEKHKQYTAEQEKYRIEEQSRRDELKKEIALVVKNDKSSSQITTLSILNLVQELDNSETQTETSKKIFEAARLSPQYFSSATVDYIALYFEEKCGNLLLNTICEIKEQSDKVLSKFTFKRVLSALDHSDNFDVAARLFNLILSDIEIDNYEEYYRTILKNCNYENSYRYIDKEACLYPNSINLFQRIFEKNNTLFTNIITEKLLIDDKFSRINIDHFLIDFCNINITAVESFLDLIIKSFQFEDDRYGESADHVTRKLLVNLYEHDHDKVINKIYDFYPTLSLDTQIEIIKFYEILLTNDKFRSDPNTILTDINQKLIGFLLNTKIESEERETLIYTIRKTSNKYPTDFLDHYNTLLGFLIKLNEELKKFEWQRKEIEDTERVTSTFNPLVGKNFYEIENIKLNIDKAISDAKDIIKNILEADTNQLLSYVLETIENIDSKSDGKLKADFIDIIKGAIKETLTIGNILSHIYTYIYDLNSDDVRNSGMKYVIHIIDKHPQIVTQTFIETVKVFFDDPSILMKGRAIEAFGNIIKRFPEQADYESIKRILDFMKNSYIFLHKSAARLSYSLYPFLDEKNFAILFSNLINLEQAYYKNKEFDFCEDLIRMLLYITKNNEKAYHRIVTTIIPKYCNSKDYYTDLKFIEHLTDIVSESHKFHDIWMPEVLRFLSKTKPDEYNSGLDSRKKLFIQFYHIDNLVFKSQLPQFIDFVRGRIDHSVFADVLDSYAILTYFDCFKEIEQLTIYFKSSIPENISLNRINLLNDKINRIANTELKAAYGNLDDGWFKDIGNDD